MTGKSNVRSDLQTVITLDSTFMREGTWTSGDAHKLSSYFTGEKFDLIYSSAVLEHFAMPWIVATEIARILKVGA